MKPIPDNVRNQMLDWLAEIGKTKRTQTIPVNHVHETDGGYKFTYFGMPGVKMLFKSDENLIVLEIDGSRLDARPLRPPETDPHQLAAILADRSHALIWQSSNDPLIAQMNYLIQTILLTAGLLTKVKIE